MIRNNFSKRDKQSMKYGLNNQLSRPSRSTRHTKENCVDNLKVFKIQTIQPIQLHGRNQDRGNVHDVS